MIFRQLFDKESSTYTYLVADPKTKRALLIDPVLEQVDRDLRVISELGLELAYVLDTHVHADHVTASGVLRERTGATTVGSPLGADCVDKKVKHGDVIELGEVRVEVLETPGHTDDSLSYRVGDNVFTGDALLIRGTGRTEFQNGDPKTLWHSLTKVLFALPDETRVWPGHDYKGMTMSTIHEEKLLNPRVAGKNETTFIDLMQNLGLPNPKKIDVAVPANRACGQSTLN